MLLVDHCAEREPAAAIRSECALTKRHDSCPTVCSAMRTLDGETNRGGWLQRDRVVGQSEDNHLTQ